MENNIPLQKSHRRGHSKAPYLGKIELYWCLQCNLPLLSKLKCDLCGTLGIGIPISPPGDVRPAFEGDLKILQEVTTFQYGSSIGSLLFPKNQIILLNRLGGIDRSDEIIMGGQIIGILTFNPRKMIFEFHPSLAGGQLILDIFNNEHLPICKTIFVKSQAIEFILEGKSILAPGIQQITQDILYNDYLIITTEQNSRSKCISIGISRGNSSEIQQMINENRGMAAKNKEHYANLTQSFPILKIEQSLSQIFRANKLFLTQKVDQAKKFIQDTINKQKLPVAVAYSGGKDSLGVLLLVHQVLGSNFKIFFADTGLELPEVVENVHAVAKFLDMEDKLIIKYAGNKFWDLVESFGPPARDFRFCCHTLKAQQISEIIETIYNGNRVLVFLGQRQYESLNRSKEKNVYVNSFIPKQIAAIPIKSWNALTLWLFLLNYKNFGLENKNSNDIPITNLYFSGQERLGCYLCPASSLAALEFLKVSHPDLMNKWISFLKRYAEKYHLPPEWIQFGLWRFKKYPAQWDEFLSNLGIRLKPQCSMVDQNIELHVTKGYSPCIQSGYSIKAKFSNLLNIDDFFEILPSFASDIEFDEEEGIINLHGQLNGIPYRMNIFADGSIFLQSQDVNLDSDRILFFTLGNAMRIAKCSQCGTCVSICPVKATRVENRQIFIDRNKCLHCFKCITHCPFVVDIKDKIKYIELGK